MPEAFRPTLRVLQRACKALSRSLGRELAVGPEAHPNGVVLPQRGRGVDYGPRLRRLLEGH